MHLADAFIQSDLQCNQAIHYFFLISTRVPWELNPRPFALLTQCSTTEPQGKKLSVKLTFFTFWFGNKSSAERWCDVNIYTSSSNNKQCNGNRSKFTRLPCLSEEGLHAVTRSRAALRTERIGGTLDRIYIRTLGYRQRYIYFLKNKEVLKRLQYKVCISSKRKQ